MFSSKRFFIGILFILMNVISSHAIRYNAYGLKFYTRETEHFRIHYHKGLEHLIPRVGAQCEKLYEIYRTTYGLTLPDKTDFVVLDGDISNGWAFPNTNTITIWSHDFDFNLRGSHDWFEDVITHEYAHIVSIQTGLKLPPAIPEIRLGYFSHPNEKQRYEAFQSFAGDILPQWFTEGIAQYSSSVHGADRWDTHRDMILRTLTLSGKLISWDNMQVFSGRGDRYEKTYDHGFSMVKYIVEMYGENKLVTLLRECNKVYRMDFNAAIKVVFGMSGKQFYEKWKHYLYTRYKKQLDSIGTQVFGRKISKEGYENYWPRFSSKDDKIYFLSNGKSDYGFKQLYTASLSDTIEEKKRIKPVAMIHRFYDLHPSSGRICFVSSHSKKSYLPAHLGGNITSDLFIDTIPPEKKKFSFFPKKTEKQITFKKSIFSAAFSPEGNKLACAKRVTDKFFLAIADTNGRDFSFVYPPKNDPGLSIDFIYSVDWSPDGKSIAFSYFDRHNRKIGLFDTTTKVCRVVCPSSHDERDPAFSPDGKYLYFSSDRTGIFNLYRYEFLTRRLQMITNVTGGAFAPSVNSNGKKVTYAGYNENGYSIYLLDSISVIKETLFDSVSIRTPMPSITYNTPLKQQRPYSYFPNQFLIVPTLLTEQTTSQSDDVNKGVPVLKTGIIFNLLEPLTLSNLGSELGGYLFIQPEQLFSFINLDHRGINVKSNYDAGLFGVTHLLPLTLSGEVLLRGIAGTDWFFNETEGEMDKLPYRLDLVTTNLQLSHYLKGDYSLGSIPKNELAGHLIAGLNRYDVNLLLSSYGIPKIFRYNLSKGYRIGTMGTFSSSVIDAARYISPRGLIAKLQYDFWNQYSLNETNSFETTEGGNIKERYDTFLFHQITGHTILGLSAPWYNKHTIHTNLEGRYLQVLKQDTTFPSYYLPGAWLPGYSYYFKDSKIVQTEANDSSVFNYDTLTVTGRAVINGEVSYRFPLSPKFIDKKCWFLYLERVYGAVNVNFGAGWDDPEDFFDFNRDDWIFAYGLEARLEAISFNTYPFAVKIRWDYGADRDAPIGGHKFTFSLGYDFDNWGLVLSPDYDRNTLSVKGL